ncbi:hypothetical protein BOX15_Mlig022594g1 [Macrostomum lignano]|uniref:Transmembrane protein n=1 Tax=Macrostomum lignano TaxID=282301 RepID=A0A267GUN6_9PLAT|nr:hypothetical protein BOX15_Mlig022594g1 [Macrostomum lignano]
MNSELHFRLLRLLSILSAVCFVLWAAFFVGYLASVRLTRNGTEVIVGPEVPYETCFYKQLVVRGLTCVGVAASLVGAIAFNFARCAAQQQEEETAAGTGDQLATAALYPQPGAPPQAAAGTLTAETASQDGRANGDKRE